VNRFWREGLKTHFFQTRQFRFQFAPDNVICAYLQKSTRDDFDDKKSEIFFFFCWKANIIQRNDNSATR
jgi:hypothetical protein